MKETETKARAGTDVPAVQGPAGEARVALAGFVEDLKHFQVEMMSKLQQQEERLTMLDRKTQTRGRPALATAIEDGVPHKKAFAAYLRSGDDDALRSIEVEGKAMSTAVAADGGYLIDPVTAQTIQGALLATASIRQIASVVNVDGSSYDVLLDRNDLGAGWATETDPTIETATPTLERVSIPLHELSALPKASQRLLDDTAFDIESWLATRVAEKFSRAEAAAFVLGDGIDKPKGFLSYSSSLAGTELWGELGHVVTGVAGDFDAAAPADAIVELVYSLGARYRANGTFVMNSKTAGAVRKLKDAEGRFLWSDGLAAGEPARLMGYPVMIAEDMPDIAPFSRSIAFGDFRAGYTIAERADLRILRDPFSAKPHVLFYATKRVGGDVTDFGAIRVLQFAP